MPVSAMAVASPLGGRGAGGGALTFQVDLQKPPGTCLGIQTVCLSGPRCCGLVVTAIIDGGALEEWNRQSTEPLRVRPGDFITHVNGVQGDAPALAAELRLRRDVCMTVRRLALEGDAVHRAMQRLPPPPPPPPPPPLPQQFAWEQQHRGPRAGSDAVSRAVAREWPTPLPEQASQTAPSAVETARQPGVCHGVPAPRLLLAGTAASAAPATQPVVQREARNAEEAVGPQGTPIQDCRSSQPSSASAAPCEQAAPTTSACLTEAFSFEVALFKGPGSKLGIGVLPLRIAGMAGLLVKHISRGGVVDMWNETCHEVFGIRVGDCIIRVNGIRSNFPSMMEELRTQEELQMVVFRKADDATGPAERRSTMPASAAMAVDAGLREGGHAPVAGSAAAGSGTSLEASDGRPGTGPPGGLAAALAEAAGWSSRAEDELEVSGHAAPPPDAVPMHLQFGAGMSFGPEEERPAGASSQPMPLKLLGRQAAVPASAAATAAGCVSRVEGAQEVVGDAAPPPDAVPTRLVFSTGRSAASDRTEGVEDRNCRAPGLRSSGSSGMRSASADEEVLRFDVEVEKKPGMRLGISVMLISGSRLSGLIIKDVEEDGCVDLWNRQSRSPYLVQPGDVVVQVNGIRNWGNLARMATEITHDRRQVSFTVQRGPHSVFEHRAVKRYLAALGAEEPRPSAPAAPPHTVLAPRPPAGPAPDSVTAPAPTPSLLPLPRLWDAPSSLLPQVAPPSEASAILTGDALTVAAIELALRMGIDALAAGLTDTMAMPPTLPAAPPAPLRLLSAFATPATPPAPSRPLSPSSEWLPPPSPRALPRSLPAASARAAQLRPADVDPPPGLTRAVWPPSDRRLPRPPEPEGPPWRQQARATHTSGAGPSAAPEGPPVAVPVPSGPLFRRHPAAVAPGAVPPAGSGGSARAPLAASDMGSVQWPQENAHRPQEARGLRATIVAAAGRGLLAEAGGPWTPASLAQEARP